METENFLGLECYPLENGSLKLLVTRSVGPRILSFGFKDGENLFAELPEVVIDTPGSEVFHFYGGHRFWHAPEEPKRTYLPDDSPVDIVPLENGSTVTQPVEPQTGLQKTLEIRLSGESAQVVITHRLTNHGLWSVTCAPWAITQLKTGGMAILPLSRMEGRLPDRNVVLWPYSTFKDERLELHDDLVLVHGRWTGTPCKIGTLTTKGWMAYALESVLFVKHFSAHTDGSFPDRSCNVETYVGETFIELETLGTLTELSPGDSMTHEETWELTAGEFPATLEKAREIDARYSLTS